MKTKAKKPAIPIERHETIRQRIISLLVEQTLSARGISNYIGIPEKEIFDHLEHIQKTLNKGEYRLIAAPSECMKCGFVFRKREKLKKPGKCPICRSELIEEPFFSIKR